MAEPGGQVRSKFVPRRADVSVALAAAWQRVSAGRKLDFAEHLDVHPKTVGRALTEESVPELHTVLASLLFDPTALDEVFELYGRRLGPAETDERADMELVTALSHGVAEYLARLSDGRICHIDLGVLAELFRPLVPQLQALIEAHDQQRGAVPTSPGGG